MKNFFNQGLLRHKFLIFLTACLLLIINASLAYKMHAEPTLTMQQLTDVIQQSDLDPALNI